MDWDEFWDLIDVGVKDRDEFKRRLNGLSEQDLVDFFWRAQERADYFLGDEKYMANMEPPYSEDEMEDIAHWVVRQGQRFYEDVVFEPSKFPGDLPDDDDDVSYTSLAGDVYHERYGDTIRAPDQPPPANA